MRAGCVLLRGWVGATAREQPWVSHNAYWGLESHLMGVCSQGDVLQRLLVCPLVWGAVVQLAELCAVRGVGRDCACERDTVVCVGVGVGLGGCA